MAMANVLAQYVDGTIIEIDGQRFALAAWDADQQLCEKEVVYAGYTESEWRHTVDASAIIVQCAPDSDLGEWRITFAPYERRFHDADGLRVVGGLRSAPDARIVTDGDAYELWAE